MRQDREGCQTSVGKLNFPHWKKKKKKTARKVKTNTNTLNMRTDHSLQRPVYDKENQGRNKSCRTTHIRLASLNSGRK